MRKFVLWQNIITPTLPILTKLLPLSQKYIPPLSELLILYSWDLNSKAQGRRIILYQPGRVGSKTVQSSLRGFNINAFTLHTLIQRDPRWILRSPKYWRAIFLEKKFNPRWLSRSAEYWRGLYLQKHLDNGFNIRKLKIITLVREPVARNVSDFFKRASPLIDLLIQKKIDLKSLRTYFLENFPHEMTLNWFDVELKQMIGLDVYSVPFPKKTGYKIYKGGDTHPDVLLLKLEKLNECASRAFKEFLGIDEFILQNKIPVGRRYYQSYKKFVSIKMLPQSYIEKMYTSKYAKHFYTDTELNEYRKKWGQWY